MQTYAHLLQYLVETLLRMKNVTDQSRRENQNTHFQFSNNFFSPENRAGYEIMRKNIAEPGRPQMII